MTAEVVILNKSAVALAADSTVTISSGSNDRKTYNSVNKLFTLSKYHPVGAMIYGDASFMGVPWEVILKEYRRHLAADSFPTLRAYLDDFVGYVERADYLKSQQAPHVWRTAFQFAMAIARAVEAKCDPTSPAPIDKAAAIDAVVGEWQTSTLR